MSGAARQHHRIVYVILAHRSAAQVARLVDRLSGPAVRVLIHVDAASTIDADLRSRVPVTTEFLPRRRARWGTFVLTEVALDGLRAALRAPFDHVVLLSGQDYPIKSPEQIRRELSSLEGRSLMRYDRFPIGTWPRGGYYRIDRHHLWQSTRFHHTVPRLTRGLPGGRWPYGGRQWWTLSQAAARAIVDAVDAEPRLRRYFRTAWITDEIFFQTVLLNTPLADTVINRDSTFALWDTGDEPAPAVMKLADLEMLRGLPHLFARKFDEAAHPGLLDRIDDEFGVRPASDRRLAA